MSFNRQSLNFKSRRGLMLSLLALSVMFAAFSVFAANAVFKQRDAAVDLKIRLCKKTADGKWEVVDEAKSSFNFSASVADVASGKDINTNHVWNPTSQKGRKISVRLQRAGKVQLNPINGLLALDLPFEVTVDGKKILLNTKLSTENTSSPIGPLSARRAVIDKNARTLTAGVAGFNTIKQRDLVDNIARVGEGKKENLGAAPGKKEGIRTPGAVGGSAGLNEELIVVIEGAGKATAKD
ncbi:MAG: hypothetical protein JMDDDDMK_03159 [Acidobacteria bacterium]|nr:hypothetical protein [Acidobacteriota bacterium]